MWVIYWGTTMHSNCGWFISLNLQITINCKAENYIESFIERLATLLFNIKTLYLQWVWSVIWQWLVNMLKTYLSSGPMFQHFYIRKDQTFVLINILVRSQSEKSVSPNSVSPLPTYISYGSTLICCCVSFI